MRPCGSLYEKMKSEASKQEDSLTTGLRAIPLGGGDWLGSHGLDGELVILTEGPSSKHPEANNRMEIIDLRRAEGK